MGKNSLVKKSILLVILVCLVMLGGCQTATGIGVGIGATAQGVAKDSVNAWNGLKSADDWMRRNLW